MRDRTHRSPQERAAKRPAGAGRRGRPAAARPKRRPPAQDRADRLGAPQPSAPAPRPRRTRSRRTLKLATGPFRLWSAFCVVAFVLSLFAARLVQLQGIDENDYAALAAAKGAQTIVLEAPRATIYDRNGAKLAETVDASKLVADPTYTHDHATQIATILHTRIGADYIDTVALLRTPGTRYVVLARHLAPLTATSVVNQLNGLNLPGVYTEHDTMRVYPAGDVAASVVGAVNADGQGVFGLERSLNGTLRGVNGQATYQVVNGQILPLASSSVKEPVEGTGVRLTIDQDLQFLAQRRLAEAVKGARADSGVAVVMDTRTSQVLALADYPTFNPNDITRKDKPNINPRSLFAAYEPGSVEKVLTFGALLDSGYVTPRTKIVVPASITADGHTILDYFPHGTIHLTAAGVIAKSSNLGMIRAAQKMPNAQLYGYLTKFGIGSPTDVGVIGATSGYLAAKPHSWPLVTRDNIDFGQGLSVNALQMATAVSAVANGGEYVAPSLVEGTVSSTGRFTAAPPPARHRVISPAAAHDVARMMETVLGPDGTAPTLGIPGYQVAGKSGTAQVADPGGGYGSALTVSFAGFAPADNPRFVVYVVIHHPRVAGAAGGATAGPVFHDLLVAALQKYGVPPTPGKPAPLLPVYW